MRKWVKRSILGLLFVAVLAAGLGYWLFRGTPSWYRPAALTPEQRTAAAESAEKKVRDTYRFAAQLQANEQRQIYAASRAGGAPMQSTTTAMPAADAFTTAFSEDELNAFFQKWSTVHRWDTHYGPYLSDPAVVLRDGKLILAGTMKELGAVASVHFRPGVTTEGRLSLQLAGVHAGRLPMPSGLWEKHRQTLRASLRGKLSAWQQNAHISPSGVANAAAIQAAMGRMMLDVLDDRPGETMLFLPMDPLDDGAVPVRVRDVTVANREVTLSVESLTPKERAALLQRIRTPLDTVTASGG